MIKRPPNKNQENTVFISYARKDSDAAKRLSKDLKIAGLTPRLDNECLPWLPGVERWKTSIRNAMKNSRYFIPLFSSISVEKRHFLQEFEFKYALEVFDAFPESHFVIPCRLDNCEIPYGKLPDTEYVDLFPNWEKGIRRVLQVMEVLPGYKGVVTSETEPLEVKPRPERLTRTKSINEQTGSRKVFVCYSRWDSGDFAERIYDYLTDAGYDVFIDVNTIRAGDVWSTVIEENISRCNLFVAIITHDALRSSHVEKEVSQALKEKKRIIPCIYKFVRNNDIKWGLGNFQGITFEDKYELARKMLSLLN